MSEKIFWREAIIVIMITYILPATIVYFNFMDLIQPFLAGFLSGTFMVINLVIVFKNFEKNKIKEMTKEEEND